jgi:hypothetical protein
MASGKVEGHEVEHWLEAERLLREQRSTTPATPNQAQSQSSIDAGTAGSDETPERGTASIGQVQSSRSLPLKVPEVPKETTPSSRVGMRASQAQPTARKSH